MKKIEIKIGKVKYTHNTAFGKYGLQNISESKKNIFDEILVSDPTLVDTNISIKDFICLSEIRGITVTLDDIQVFRINTIFNTISDTKFEIPFTINFGVKFGGECKLTVGLISKVCKKYGYTKQGNMIWKQSHKAAEDDFANHHRTTSYLKMVCDNNMTDEQQNIITEINKDNLFMNYIVCGPGRGKSYLACKGISGNSYLGVTPTHASKKVLIENGMVNTNTIHKMYFTALVNAMKNKDNPKYSFLVIDEISMCGIQHIKMLNTIIKLYNIQKVILLGDPKQLNSIGKGSILDIPVVIKYKKYQLTKNFRAKDAEGISMFEKYVSDHLYGSNKVDYNHIEDIAKTIANTCDDIVLIDAISDFMYENESSIISGRSKIICWTNDDCKNINTNIKKALFGSVDDNPADGELRMCNRNGEIDNYFNGDIDIITIINSKIYFGEQQITEQEYKWFTTSAYAITAHKSQGATYDTICIYNSYVGSHFSLNLIYTSATRPKNKLYFVKHDSKTNITEQPQIVTAGGYVKC